MGIYDRDYIRRDPPKRGAYGQGGSAGLRRWSVNTWLIVACVAVFVIDGFLPERLYDMGPPILFEGVTEVPDGAVVEGPAQRFAVHKKLADGTQVPIEGAGQRVLSEPGGPQIGWQPLIRMHPLQGWLHFSTYRGFFKLEFWRLIGFQFLHGDQWHLIFNMIGLFFFGPIVENYLGRKRYLAFYLLCGICGALAYVILNLGGIMVTDVFKWSVSVPGLLFNQVGTPLIGASAGVFGVLMAGAFLAPNATVLAFFFIPIRLQIFAYILVAAAFITVLGHGPNAGGEAGHLGGALAGWYFIRHTRHLHGFFDLVGWADPTSHHYRGRRRKMPHGAGGAGGAGGARVAMDRREIDRILDKISERGLKSLTEREKKILHEASRE